MAPQSRLGQEHPTSSHGRKSPSGRTGESFETDRFTPAERPPPTVGTLRTPFPGWERSLHEFSTAAVGMAADNSGAPQQYAKTSNGFWYLPRLEAQQ